MKRLIIILLLAAMACALFAARQFTRQRDFNAAVGTARQESVEYTAAMRKAAKFLQPDTTGEIRFGHPNAQKPSPRGSPTPTIP